MLVDSDQSVDHGFGSQLEHLVATTAPMVQGANLGASRSTGATWGLRWWSRFGLNG